MIDVKVVFGFLIAVLIGTVFWFGLDLKEYVESRDNNGESTSFFDVVDFEGHWNIDQKTTERMVDVFNQNVVKTSNSVSTDGKYLGKVKIGYFGEAYNIFEVYEYKRDVYFVFDSRSSKVSNQLSIVTGKDAEFAKLVMANDAKANTFSWTTK